jgi:hypothetical protein
MLECPQSSDDGRIQETLKAILGITREVALWMDRGELHAPDGS